MPSTATGPSCGVEERLVSYQANQGRPRRVQAVCDMPRLQRGGEESTRPNEGSVSDPAPHRKPPTAPAALLAIHHDPHDINIGRGRTGNRTGRQGDAEMTSHARRDATHLLRCATHLHPPASTSAPPGRRTSRRPPVKQRTGVAGAGVRQPPASATAGRPAGGWLPPPRPPARAHGRGGGRQGANGNKNIRPPAALGLHSTHRSQTKPTPRTHARVVARGHKQMWPPLLQPQKASGSGPEQGD